MALTDTFVRQVKHSGRATGDKHADGGGLYLHVLAAGKYWRLAYRFDGKQKVLALGVYPIVTLAAARRKRDEARQLLEAGTDPGLAKRIAKATARVSAGNTFEAVATEYHASKSAAWSPKYAERWLRLLRKDLFPYIGAIPLTDITAPMVLDALRKAEKRGVLEVAHTLRQSAGQVFRYGVQTGRCASNPVTDLHGALQPIVVKHMAAVLEPVKAGELLRAIDGYTGQPATRAALLLSALLFQRPGNIRAMEWSWLNLDEAMLTIPAESMKRRLHEKINGRPHFVPLAPQAVEVLRELHPLTGHGRYVFPGLRTGERPMSENTVNAAMRRLGFSGEEMSAHGFRAMARTLIVENIPGIHPDVIEAQLAHGKSGPLGSAYDRAEFMQQRRQMMVTWAGYLDKLRTGGNVIPLHRAA